MLLVILILVGETDCLSAELDLLALNKTLFTLDNKILSFISEPDCTLRDTFLKWFDDYNTHFCQLISLLNDEEVRAEPVARSLLKNNGPAFLKIDINCEFLKDKLFWGDHDIQEMYYLMGATKVLWFELKNVLSPYGERHIRNINVPQELYEMDIRGRLSEFLDFTNTGDIKDPKDNSTTRTIE